jgi:hypothetical protein
MTPPATGLNVLEHLNQNRVWWQMPVVSALGRLRQEDHEFQASLGYIARPHVKKKKKSN